MRTPALMTVAAVALALTAAHPAQAASKGLALIQKSDCVACHTFKKSEPKKVGPSYEEVAAKYKGKKVTDQLVAKIAKGGAGVWGQVPMTPHPQVSQADLKLMVNYILTGK